MAKYESKSFFGRWLDKKTSSLTKSEVLKLVYKLRSFVTPDPRSPWLEISAEKRVRTKELKEHPFFVCGGIFHVCFLLKSYLFNTLRWPIEMALSKVVSLLFTKVLTDSNWATVSYPSSTQLLHRVSDFCNFSVPRRKRLFFPHPKSIDYCSKYNACVNSQSTTTWRFVPEWELCSGCTIPISLFIPLWEFRSGTTDMKSYRYDFWYESLCRYLVNKYIIALSEKRDELVPEWKACRYHVNLPEVTSYTGRSWNKLPEGGGV